MFAKSDIQTKLDTEIISLLDKLKVTPKETDEYATIVERLSELHKLKSEEAQNQIKIEETLHQFEADSKWKLPSSDTMLVVAANIFGILWLARYERENVIKSRSALGFVMRPRG